VVEAVAAAMPGRDVLHFRLRFSDVRPSAADVETVLGYGKDAAPPPVRDGVAGLLASGEELWAIEGGCVVHPARIDGAARRLAIEGVELDVEEIVAGQLQRSEAVAVFLCTAGPEIGELSRRLMAEGDPFTAFIADTVGSLVVERAMDAVQDRLQDAMTARGLRITNRYSPGYCGWNVRDQQNLFRLLPPAFCGVRLTESSLMQPIKSVSGVIGIGPDVRRVPYTCRLCDREDCLYRRLQPSIEPAPAAS
jgi:cobalamin-dependent methionine synthase-like protein